MSSPHAGLPAPATAGVRPALGAAERAVFVLLLLLVWGLFAPDRGFIQDEPWILNAARDARAGALGFLWPARTLALVPQRPLLGLPFALAWLTPWPRLASQLFFGGACLASALAMACVARRLRPGRPAVAFAAGALTLTATGDHAFGSLAYLSAYVAAASVAVALAALLAWEQTGARRQLAGALVALAFGLLTYDGVLAAGLALPALAWGLAPAGPAGLDVRRRRALGSLACAAVLLPYGALFVVSLQRAGSYAERMVEQPPPAEWLARAVRLFALNFAPWRWSSVFVRPEDGTTAQLLAPVWRVGLAGAGALVFCVVALRLARRAVPTPAPRFPLRELLALLAAAALANGAVALVSAAPHRTQLASRLFASLALALGADALTERRARVGAYWARAPALLVTVFVAFGLDAGLVSQDYHLTLWRRHRAELRSIVDQVPGLAAEAGMLLRLPKGAPFTSFYYPAVGGPWLDYLYGAPPRAVIWSADGPMACSLAVGAFVCRDRRRTACYASGECAPLVLPVERTLLLDYVPASGRFELRARLPDDLLAKATAPAVEAAEARYAPRASIVAHPRTRAARELLDTPEWLGRLLKPR